MESYPFNQDLRTWALESLIKYEGNLDTRMYTFADLYIGLNSSKDTKVLYTLWNGWKTDNPDNPKYKL